MADLEKKYTPRSDVAAPELLDYINSPNTELRRSVIDEISQRED